MGNIFLAIIMGVLSLNLFTSNYKVIGVNRTLYNLPIALFETSIILTNETDEPLIYFDRVTLKSKLTSYFDNNLKKYTDKYTVEYYYYKQDDNSLCLINGCDAVKVTLTADLFYITKYKKSAYFYIRSNK